MVVCKAPSENVELSLLNSGVTVYSILTLATTESASAYSIGAATVASLHWLEYTTWSKL